MISLSASDSPAPAPADAPALPTTISVQDLAITYRTNLQKAPTLKSTLVRLGRRERIVREVQALKGISFDVPEGTVMGIVGANGAGKSTLMRSVAGILAPTSGRVEVHGKVSTLLSLGVGFNGALSGRQNVVLGGLAAGLSRKDIAQKYDEITAFAELEDYMDMPMRTYSSGMFGRLAFAVAVHMDPDILLIDEALSAGDAHFKEKARAKMDELAAKARTMLIVSHGLGTIRDMCNEALWLHKGELMMRGAPQEVIDSYTRFLKVGETSATMEDF
ncbi:MAG TPA: ABC transporter ATP-binding protein [Mycobacteriales bacterium]|nr:ABC transporter ATP-binding protein [Mycobacteriales bacterium]